MSDTPKRTAVHNPELKKLRAVAFLRERVMGNSISDVAQKFHVSESTVERVLTYAKRANIIVEESDRILEDMVPLARKVLTDALAEGDVTVALEVYKGTGLLGNKGKPSGGNTDDDELLRSINDLRRQAQQLENTTDAELLPQRDVLSLPPGGPQGTLQPGGTGEDAPPAETAASARAVDDQDVGDQSEHPQRGR